MTHLKTLKGAQKIVVVSEQHKDGTPHLHAYVSLSVEYRCRGDHKALKVNGNYPNVQSVKNKFKWLSYLKKSDDEPLEYNMSLSEDTTAMQSKKRILGKRLIEGAQLHELVVEEGNESMVLEYDKFKKAITAFQLDQLNKTVEATAGTKGLFVFGPPGCGKSKFIRDQSIK
ncbi:MAG: Rep catalytic domain protein [Cressdnaviricota sp.]|nr:MAG: Rep catalytic domain protein [Cressdnaviricota sp.]